MTQLDARIKKQLTPEQLKAAWEIYNANAILYSGTLKSDKFYNWRHRDRILKSASVSAINGVPLRLIDTDYGKRHGWAKQNLIKCLDEWNENNG